MLFGSSANFSQRLEPIKPAPPVTSIFFISLFVVSAYTIDVSVYLIVL